MCVMNRIVLVGVCCHFQANQFGVTEITLHMVCIFVVMQSDPGEEYAASDD